MPPGRVDAAAVFAIAYELMTSTLVKVVDSVEALLAEDPWPSIDSWGMSPEAAANAARAEQMAGGPAPMRDPNVKRPQSPG